MVSSGTRLFRAVASAAAVTATAVASSSAASASPPADQQNYVSVAEQLVNVNNCAGECAPQQILFSTKGGTTYIDFTLVSSVGCENNPQVQAFVGGVYEPLNQAFPLNVNTLYLKLTSHCGSAGALPEPRAWIGHVVIWTSAPASANSGPGDSPAPAHSITGDVNLYDKPGGHGKIVGMARQGDAVTLNGPCPIKSQGDTNGWCLIDDTTQHKSGAVWGEYVK